MLIRNLNVGLNGILRLLEDDLPRALTNALRRRNNRLRRHDQVLLIRRLLNTRVMLILSVCVVSLIPRLLISYL